MQESRIIISMNKLLDFGRKALFYVRVLSGYEERRIRSFRLELEQRMKQVLLNFQCHFCSAFFVVLWCCVFCAFLSCATCFIWVSWVVYLFQTSLLFRELLSQSKQSIWRVHHWYCIIWIIYIYIYIYIYEMGSSYTICRL